MRFFFYPTWNKPSGGNKQLRLMASLLMELGVENYYPGTNDPHTLTRSASEEVSRWRFGLV
jgi:hypothetical protein